MTQATDIDLTPPTQFDLEPKTSSRPAKTYPPRVILTPDSKKNYFVIRPPSDIKLTPPTQFYLEPKTLTRLAITK